MRKDLVAVFCASLLIFMLLPTPTTVDSDLDDVEILDSSGSTASVDSLAWELAQKAGGSSGDDRSNSIAVSANGDVYVTGSFKNTAYFGDTILTSAGDWDIFVAKMNSTGYWFWAVQAGGSNQDIGEGIALDSSGNVFVTGTFQISAQFGTNSLTTNNGNAYDPYVAKISSNGAWQWVNRGTGSGGSANTGTDVAVDSNGYAYVTGYFSRNIGFDSTTLTWSGMYDIFVAKIDTLGNWQWATMAGGAQGDELPNAITIGPNGDVYLTGYFQFTSTFGSNSLTSQTGKDAFVAKVSAQGNWMWSEAMGGGSNDIGNSIVVDSQGDVYVSGSFYSGISFGNFSYGAGGVSNSFIAKALDQGNSVHWDWARQVSSSSSNAAFGMTLDSNQDVLITGQFRGTASFGNTALTSSGDYDVYVAKLRSNGNWSWAQEAGGGNEDNGLGVGVDSQGSLYVTGYFIQNAISFNNIDLSISGGFDGFIAKMSPDYDRDNIPDSLDTDDDGDGVPDEFDDCNPSPLGFQTMTSTDRDGDGCRDSDEDDDDDGDGVLDENDDCPRGATGWERNNTTDIDLDGCRDFDEDNDDDGDGFEDFMDLCPKLNGNSTYQYEEGCPDSDGDGRPDVKEPFPQDPTEWEDSDRDGIGNNSDAFPNDPTQTMDTDGDGFGDYPFGNFPDGCPDDFGTSLIDYYGCVDSDGDGVSDINDRFPNDPDVWQDTDQDGVEDGLDAFPYNPTQSTDSDSDGFGDNPMGSNADRFVDDETQWSDVDGDGYGDNPNGNMPDAFPLDPTQWMDSDGDGYGDNPSGNVPDAFPLDTTQWLDDDNDGLGDNPNGNNPDPHLFDSDNDGYDNSEDPLPLKPTPGDKDNDGVPDEIDWAPDNPYEWSDFDGDGVGDNEDIDDDNDKFEDWLEIREGTLPKDPDSYPVDSFEIPITDDIALSAWDLLMLLAGLPLASWLIFGFVTRNARTEMFEGRMRVASTREELEEVATEYERALMIRLIGPHQGIRLERVRAELDDEIEMSEAVLTGEGDDLDPIITSTDQTDYTEEELGMQPPEDADIIDDGKGYEWIEKGDEKWYRPVETSSWTRWET